MFFRMDRSGSGHAPPLQGAAVIGVEARSPPPLTDYSYHLVRFHEAIIRLHTLPTLGMADYRIQAGKGGGASKHQSHSYEEKSALALPLICDERWTDGGRGDAGRLQPGGEEQGGEEGGGGEQPGGSFGGT